MRLKSYFGSDLGEAMARVRRELGEEAVIVSVHDGEEDKQTHVIAAIGRVEPEDEFVDSVVFEPTVSGPDAPIRATIGDMLARHGTPPRLAGLLVSTARTTDTRDPILALGSALDTLFTFKPVTYSGRPILLVGPPGAGKTVTLAKLGARAAIDGKTVGIMTTDCVRTGGVDQLAGLAKHFEVQTGVAEDPQALAAGLHELARHDLVLIDSVGTNPFVENEMRALEAHGEASRAEMVLVLPAGLDCSESAEIAEAFAAIGAKRLIVTRLDSARRLGGCLAAAHAASLAFAEAGTAPNLIDSLGPFNPVGLARLLARPWGDASEHPPTEGSA